MDDPAVGVNPPPGLELSDLVDKSFCPRSVTMFTQCFLHEATFSSPVSGGSSFRGRNYSWAECYQEEGPCPHCGLHELQGTLPPGDNYTLERTAAWGVSQRERGLKGHPKTKKSNKREPGPKWPGFPHGLTWTLEWGPVCTAAQGSAGQREHWGGIRADPATGPWRPAWTRWSLVVWSVRHRCSP